MAGGVKTLPRLLVSAALTAAACLACAKGSLPDPTRPPEQMMRMTRPAAQKPVAAHGGVGLQTVILRVGHKPIAVIDGVTVKLGGRVGNAKLVKLNESEAVLDGPNGKRVLRLTPDAEKTAVIRQHKRHAKRGDHE